MRQTHKTHGSSWGGVGSVSRRTPAYLEMGVIYRSSPLFFFGVVYLGCFFLEVIFEK